MSCAFKTAGQPSAILQILQSPPPSVVRGEVFNTQDKRFGGPGSGTLVTVPAEVPVTEGTMKLLLPAARSLQAFCPQGLKQQPKSGSEPLLAKAQTGVVLVPVLCAEGLSSEIWLQGMNFRSPRFDAAGISLSLVQGQDASAAVIRCLRRPACRCILSAL